MSVPTTLQSRLIPMALSTDGITYRNVVCKRTMNFTGSTPTNQEDTDCDTFTALGSNTWSFDFEGVFNLTPDSNQYSAKEILDFWNNQTVLYVKVQYPTSGGSTGTNLYLQGQGYLTGTGISTQTGNLVAFTFTFSGNGALDTSV